MTLIGIRLRIVGIQNGDLLQKSNLLLGLKNVYARNCSYASVIDAEVADW